VAKPGGGVSPTLSALRSRVRRQFDHNNRQKQAFFPLVSGLLLKAE